MFVASFICLSRVISEKMLNWIFHSFVSNPQFQHWSEFVTKNLCSIWDLLILLCFFSNVRIFLSTRTSSVGSVDWINKIFRDICLTFLARLFFYCYWLRSSQIIAVGCFFLEMTKSLKISSLISLSLIYFTKIWSLSCLSFCCFSELDSLDNIMLFIIVIWLLFIWDKNSGDFDAFLSYSPFFTTNFLFVSSPCCTKCPTKRSYLDPVGFTFFASSLWCVALYLYSIKLLQYFWILFFLLDM